MADYRAGLVSMDQQPDLAAGEFSSWMGEIQGAICGERGSDVPCNGCTACCTSSQFVHIAPDERETLAHVPAELLFPAPGLPRGHVLLGYDERGHCPMLVDGRCSIYDHRPQTCRTYDCRVFAATGLTIDDDDKVSIARRVQRWEFSFPTRADRTQHEAVRAAATFLRDHGEQLAPAANITQLAVMAIEVHDAFLRRDEPTGETAVVAPDPAAVRVELGRRRSHGAAAGSHPAL
jgi:Fe-S-cluster containining protein